MTGPRGSTTLATCCSTQTKDRATAGTGDRERGELPDMASDPPW